MGMYHVAKSINGQFFWSLRAANGERILQSEMYTTKGAALGGIASCKENSADDARYIRKEAKNGEPYFVLHAGNNQVIGASEMYSSPQALEVGIESCKMNGPKSGTKDETGEE